MKKIVLVVLLGVFVFSISCIEDIEFETETFESALVIEATITNEMKPQEIILSRTFRLEEDGPNPESGANVSISSDGGIINFNETEPGIYTSDSEFSAQQNVNYRLNIVTSNGRTYTSSTTQLTIATQIDELYAVRESNDDGVNGMSIYVDSYDPTGNSNFYRYEYEETYKIIAPEWVPEKLVVLNEDFPCDVKLVPRTQEVQICYNTVKSININQTNTVSVSEDRVSRHLIRFVDSENFILSYRYSILVRQFIQSRSAYTYYETLNEFSGEGSLFSQTQPGFFSGNIFSESNKEEKVIGFFDVSTVTSKRIFFNYNEFYPNENLPPFPVNCIPIEHDQIVPSMPPTCGPLITELLRDRVVYHSGASNIQDTTFLPNGEIIIDTIAVGTFLMLLKQCGDCTALGSNIEPDFWEE